MRENKQLTYRINEDAIKNGRDDEVMRPTGRTIHYGKTRIDEYAEADKGYMTAWFYLTPGGWSCGSDSIEEVLAMLDEEV